MAYSWNTKPNTNASQTTYSWSSPERKAEIEQRVQFVRSNPPKSLASRLFTGVKETVVGAFKEKEKTDLNLARGIIKPAYQVWSDTVVDTSNRFSAAMDAYTKPGPNDKADVAIKTAQAGLGGVNLLFAPVTGVLKGLESNPVVGYLATSVNALFAAIGTGSSIVAVDQLEKSGLSRETKDKLTPLVAEVAALTGMLAAGKGGSAIYGKLKTNTKSILETVKEDTPKKPSATGVSYPLKVDIPVKDWRIQNGPIRVQNWDRMHKVPINFKGVDVKEWSRYTPDSELPTIDFGSKPRTEGKTIQIGDPGISTPDGYTYSPIKEQFVPAPATNKAIRDARQKQIILSPESVPKSKTFTTETGPFQPTGALKFKAEAEKRGLSVGEVPFVERQKNIEQWKSADEFVANDLRGALRAYRGDAELPAGVLRNALEGALEKYVLTSGDMSLANELVKSKLGTETARELQTRNRPLSETNPIQAAREIRTERMSAEKDIDARIKTERAKIEPIRPPSIDTWKEFIKTMEC